MRRGDFIEVRKAHEDDEGFGRADLRPIDLQHIMAGDESDDRGVVAMRERNAGVSGDAQRRCHAGHDLERNAGIGQRFGLFAAAPEDERVAAFQTNDVEAAFAAIDQQRADLFLRQRVIRLLLADVDALGGSGSEIEQIRNWPGGRKESQSACSSRRLALRVMSSGSPGPAPTR